MIKYIPEFIFEKFEQKRLNGKFNGIALFFDIKDFTTITEKLTRKGQKGAEVINGILQKTFSPVINIIEKRGGFVTGFAGDAFMSVFPEPVADNIIDVYRAVRENLDNSEPIKEIAEDYRVDARLVVSYGEICWRIFNNDIQNEYYFFGEAINECNQLAEKKIDVLFSDAAVSMIGKEKFCRNGTEFVPKDDIEITPVTIVKKYEYKKTTENLFLNKLFLELKVENEIRDIANTFIDLNKIKPEDLNETIKQIEIIGDRYQAFFNKLDYSDKGLLGIIVFGAPRKKEKTLDRIMYFALDLSEKVKNIKSGISSGRVYAGYTGSDDVREYTILGYPPNLASRLMMKAETGQILVDVFSEELLQNRFEFELLGEIGMKGFTEKLPVYKFLNEKQCEDHSDRTPFTGRIDETGNIIESLNVNESCNIISVNGLPGIGKSRLIDNVKNNINLSRVYWCYFLCDGILKSPYAPVIRFLKEYFQFDSSADYETNERTFSHLWDEIAGSNDEMIRIKSIIGQLLDFHWRDSIWELLPTEVKQIQERNALISFFLQLAERKQVIIQIEDGQWIDNETHELLLGLIKEDINKSVKLIILSRFNEDGSVIDYKFENSNLINIELLPLADEDTLKIASHQIKIDKIPSQTADFIIKKSQGNPLFAEQISLYLAEQNYLDEKGNLQRDVEIVTAFGISDIIGARIDNLTDQIRQLVYYASVLGIEFNIQILSKMLMEDLIDKAEVIVDNCIWNKIKELQYIFSQILFRDTAYSRMLEEKRRNLNILAAESYEKIYPKEQLKNYYEMIALHYERGDNPDMANRYYTRAFFSAYRDTRLGKALKLAKKSLELAEILPYLSRRVANSFYCTGLVYHALGKYSDSLKYNLQALPLFEKDEVKPAIIIAVLNNIGNAYSLLGEYDKALQYHDKSLILRKNELGEEHPEYAMSLVHLANIYMQTKRYDEAEEHYQKALNILLNTDGGVESRLILCYYNIGAFYFQIEDFQKSLENLQKALPILEKIDALEKPQAASIFRQIAIVYDELDNFENAKNFLNKAIDIDEKFFGAHHPSSGNNYHYLGKVYLKYDQRTIAETFLKKALVVYLEFYGENHAATMDVFYQLGKFFEQEEKFDDACEYYQKYRKYLMENNENIDKIKDCIERCNCFK